LRDDLARKRPRFPAIDISISYARHPKILLLPLLYPLRNYVLVPSFE
jgi:hypothetical protein